MANTAPPARTQQLIRGGERRMFAAGDDNAMLKQIQATHAPDGRDFEVKPILQIIEDIFHHAAPSSIDGIVNGTHAHLEALDDKMISSSIEGILEALAYTIYKICCEISCKCSGGGDAHQTSMVLLNTLSGYSWESKVVIALAAFAVIYGEFWLLVQLYTTNQLAKSVALLKQLPDIIEHASLLKPKFDSVQNLIKAMLNVTKSIVAFTDLPSQYIPIETPAMSAAMAHIPTAVYWTIRSVVACASQITSLIGLSHEYITSTMEAWELSSLAHKVNSIHGHLTNQLTLCHQFIDEKKHIEAYLLLVKILETIHMDNMRVLKALIYPKDDVPPLFDGSTKTRVHIEVLRRKTVLLLISDLDITQEEILVLSHLYREARHGPTRTEMPYEMVWLSILDRSTPLNQARQEKFEQLKNEMPWHSIHHPSMVEPAVIKYTKEVWHFAKKPILVALDPQGKVVSPNAFHMMWIWGNLAAPFTDTKEQALWREETWRVDFLVDGIDEAILQWVAAEKFICLYGGEDIEWIRKFTITVKKVAASAGIDLELIYMGKSNSKERTRKINAIVTAENLSHCLPDLTFLWFFWTRLESMLYSKMQHGKTIENDRIMQEVMTILSFDGSDQGWAVICKGSAPEMARAKGDLMFTCFSEFETWRGKAEEKGFLQAVIDHLTHLHTPQHCNRLILPGINGNIPEIVVCAECGRPMEKYFMYRCCTD
ncbi:Sieve element occlusion, C-terminal [Dillenia turbinata]|uniref:Sieve element occlusion, C-terminal n=1 Tax=Dillenia turbinata TaxID=194707 RepID=A0AAN8UP71_9MAGN